ncbi:MerR family transcriptional regulator [Nocardioidaceae bacterium SCSIO 66511]|nr:MerR family transcriptional regulator [Nocardioidaceae bacterium SCSIO 66511]
MRSSEVARAAGVNVQTLRYYERRGLIADPQRSLGGHRLYPDETVTVVRVIRAAQRLGFSLDEVGELLDNRRRDAGDLRNRAVEKLRAIEEQIADLTIVAHTLQAALDAECDDLLTCAHDPTCPLPLDTPPNRVVS